LRDSAQFLVKVSSYKQNLFSGGMQMNFITVVRGKLKDPTSAQKAHDATVALLAPMSRPMGALHHQPFINPQNPGEFLAVDSWSNVEGLQKFLQDPTVATEFGKLFDGMPDVTVWSESGWSSF
jgi:quinol monooxygenase YgiN